MSNNFSLVSLFSGIGGLDEGLHQAGFRSLLCCEKDDYAHASLQNWIALRGLSPQIERDVTTVDPAGVRQRLGLAQGDLDLLAGGPPCQSFSLIGKRGSLTDPRGLLLFEMVRFARELLPKVVLIEQVKGLRSAPGPEGKRGGALLLLKSALSGLGYEVEHRLLRASSYGVPQHRDRIFIVATRAGYRFRFPGATHFDVDKLTAVERLSGGRPGYVTVRDVIGELPPPVLKGLPAAVPNHIDVTPRRDRERIHGVPEGAFLAGQLHLPADQRLRLNPKKDTTKFRRLSWDAPSLTLRGGEAFYHPIEDRYITPREAMRIHGFPDAHVLDGPIRGRSGSYNGLDQHRQVANAVPPGLASTLGHEIAHTLNAQPVRTSARLTAV